jgi:hypothetical protein
MSGLYYDCNTSFTEPACSGFNLAQNDNKDNPKLTEIIDGKYIQNENLQQGEQAESGDTDSDLLAKIVDNTGKFVVNQQNISDQITGIANQIQDKKSFESELNNNDILNKMSADDSAAQAVLDSKSSIIQGADASDYEGQSKFTPDDEYNTSIDGMIEGLSSDGSVGSLVDKYVDNTVVTGFQNTQIEIVDPECRFEMPFNVLGFQSNIDLDFCVWDSELTTVGNISYYILLVGCLIMVLRGKGD